jgi:hypothetical protein
MVHPAYLCLILISLHTCTSLAERFSIEVWDNTNCTGTPTISVVYGTFEECDKTSQYFLRGEDIYTWYISSILPLLLSFLPPNNSFY